MTRAAAALAALLALAACGGDDPEPKRWTPPVVDMDRLGVACPAPDVPILVRDPSSLPGARGCYEPSYNDPPPYEVPASEVIPGFHWVGSFGGDWNRVSDVVVIEGAQRLRLTLADGRSGLFTADHGFRVIASDTAFVWALYELRPGDRLGAVYGETGVVANVENAPDGPVVQIKVTEDASDPCYVSGPLIYRTMGLDSFVHTTIAAPSPRPPGL